MPLGEVGVLQRFLIHGPAGVLRRQLGGDRRERTGVHTRRSGGHDEGETIGRHREEAGREQGTVLVIPAALPLGGCNLGRARLLRRGIELAEIDELPIERRGATDDLQGSLHARLPHICRAQNLVPVDEQRERVAQTIDIDRALEPDDQLPCVLRPVRPNRPGELLLWGEPVADCVLVLHVRAFRRRGQCDVRGIGERF